MWETDTDLERETPSWTSTRGLMSKRAGKFGPGSLRDGLMV